MPAVAIECLESRLLMAQTLGQLMTQMAGNVAAIRKTLSASTSISAADQRALASRLRPVSTANAALLKALAADFKAALANTRSNLGLATLIGTSDVKKVQAAASVTVHHNLSAKTLAVANAALAKLAADDNAFVSAQAVQAFYTLTAAPQTDEAQIGTANPANAKLAASLAALEARANFSTRLFPEFNALVGNISTFATDITTTIPGTVF